MISFANITNRFVLSLISALIIITIGFLDWYTGYELTLSIFYLIPIALLALYKNVNRAQLIVNSALSAVVWFVADYNTQHTYSSIFFPLWEAFARVVIYLAISELIYSLKKEHQKLLDSNRRLKNLNDEKNKLLGIAAHDLRNPIAAMVSFSEILLNKKDANQDDMHRLLGLINQSSKNSLNLLTDLLDVSRIEAGTVNIKFQPINYLEFVKKSIYINQLIADRKNIKILLESTLESIVIEADPVYLEEVLNNLISNAIKYSFEKSTVFIKISKPNDHILTEIIDTGVGIPENEIKQLFNPFQKSSAKPTSGESSTGLGLAIVKKIVNLHNGEVGISSVINEGTNAYFYLPERHIKNQVK